MNLQMGDRLKIDIIIFDIHIFFRLKRVKTS